MRHVIAFIVAYLFLVMLMFPGCSGGGNPISTENHPSEFLNDIPTTALTEAGESSNALGILGAYELTVNPDKMTTELVSKRISTIGESYIVNGIRFFTVTPCSDCLKVTGIGSDAGNVVLKFSIKHPFEQGNTSLPPTALNRLDLDLFDLAMLIKPEATTAQNFPLIGTDVYSGIVANAHGYTKELANIIGDDSAIPFVLVVDNSMDDTKTFNEFSMGANKEFQVALKLALGTQVRFEVYLTMGYGASAKKPGRLAPKYYNPEFNRKSAWKVAVNPQGEWLDNDDTTPVDVEVKVYDWQIGATVYGTPSDFANAPSNNVYAASEVARVSVEIPGMTTTLPSVSTPDSGSGTPSDPLIFTVPVANQNELAAGEYTGIVKVLDERPCLTVTDNRDIIIDPPVGEPNEFYPMPEYATYQIFTATVIEGIPPCSGLCWAKRAGNVNADVGRGITTLSDNSTIITGYFNNSVTFGQGDPNETILSSAGNYDIFIARYNVDGTLAWAKRAGGIYEDAGYSVTTLSDDSIVVTGYYIGSATFGQGEPNQTTLPLYVNPNIFIARFNPNGTLIWAKWAAGSNTERGCGITTLSDDSIVVTGYFAASCVFGFGEPNQTTLVPTVSSDIFIARYNVDGSLSWAKHAGGTMDTFSNAITTLSDNSIVVTGTFQGSATFGQGEPSPTILTVSGEDDIFIARYNANGTLSWAKRAGGTLTDISHAITTLSDDSTVVTGCFEGTATFGPGELSQTILGSFGFWDIFIARYNTNGTLSWAKRAGGIYDEEGFGITTLSDNSTVLTGYFERSATFGPGEPNQTILSSAGIDDIFIARYNTDGSLSWVKSSGGTTNDHGQSITTLSDSSVVVTGWFSGSATFGPGEPNQTLLSSAGNLDIFIARYKY